MCLPSSPYQPPRSPSLKISATPPTLLPLSFSSEPIIDLNELMSSADMPAVTFIPPELAEPTQHSSQQRILHAHSDCGHYGSPPQLNRSHSLLRNFSVRSRNTLRKRQHQAHRPSPSVSASRQGILRTDSASTASRSSILSVWKKWRAKSVTNLSTSGSRDGELDAISPQHHAMPYPQGTAKKRTFFLPVGRLIAPFQIPSSSTPPSDDWPCIIMPQSPLIGQVSARLSNLGAIQDEDVEFIRQVPDVVLESDSELLSTDMPPLPPLPSGSPPPLTPSSPDYSSSSSPPLLTPSSLNSPLSSSPLLLTPCYTISPPPLPSLTNSSLSPPLPAFQPILHIPSSPSPDVNSALPPESNSQLSSNPNLKPSISQRRRAKFTLGDGSDLDYDSLAVSASGTVAVARAPSPNVENEAESMVLSNDSTQPNTATTLTPNDSFILESRDQVGNASTPIATKKLTRRWTLSSALTDEGISDEGLVKELEKMRDVVEWDCSPIDNDEHESPSSSPPPSPTNPSNPWLITQRALLTTRELILTERHYLSSLLLLVCPDSTLTPVPEMMVLHAKELIDVSRRLLKGMEGEPSARGVAEVFVEVGEGLSEDGAESAFVGWCGAVGGWFQDELADTQGAVDVKRKRKGYGSVGGSGEYQLLISEHEGSAPGGVTFPTSTTTGEDANPSPLKRTVSTWRKSMPSVPGLGEGVVWRRDKDKDKDEGSSTYGRGRIAIDEVTLTGKPLRKPAVRDLAILPTQRVTRYVLLYRDLLANTPPSCSTYPIVERALEAACRIAEKCNRAQGNAAFVAGATRDSSSWSGSSTLILNSSNSKRRRLFSHRRVMTVPEPINMKPKSGYGSIKLSSSPTSSPTKSHFLLSSIPASSPSTSSILSPTPSSVSRPDSPTKNLLALLPPPPPSSFNSKIPIASSRQSFGSSTLAVSSSTTTTTISTFSSSSSSSSSSLSFPPLSSMPPLPLLFLPKPKLTSSSSPNVSLRVPKPLSFMSLANDFGRSVSGHAGAGVADGTITTTTTAGGGGGGGADSVISAPMKGYASAIPTKIKV